MKILRALGRLGFASLLLYGAVTEIARPNLDAPVARPPAAKPNLIIKTAVLTIIAVLIIAAAGGLLFMYSGVYPLAADKPHFAPVRWLLQTGRTRSVKLHSAGIRAPNLVDGTLIRKGFVLFRKNCQPCHGAPGIPADQTGLGINPKPPNLVTAGNDWNAAELYWIVTHGLKLSGMPAFAPRLSDSDLWGIVAFLRRLDRLSPTDYKRLIEAADAGVDPSDWGADDDEGFAKIRAADPERGKQLLGQYGCVSCHTIPAMSGAHVGPPLTAFAERQYLAGSLVNLPSNAMNWIMNPKQYKPQTAMPVLGVKPRDSADIAAFLYKLGNRRRLDTLQRTSAHNR